MHNGDGYQHKYTAFYVRIHTETMGITLKSPAMHIVFTSGCSGNWETDLIRSKDCCCIHILYYVYVQVTIELYMLHIQITTCIYCTQTSSTRAWNWAAWSRRVFLSSIPRDSCSQTELSSVSKEELDSWSSWHDLRVLWAANTKSQPYL